MREENELLKTLEQVHVSMVQLLRQYVTTLYVRGTSCCGLLDG